MGWCVNIGFHQGHADYLMSPIDQWGLVCGHFDLKGNFPVLIFEDVRQALKDPSRFFEYGTLRKSAQTVLMRKFDADMNTVRNIAKLMLKLLISLTTVFLTQPP